MADEQPLHKGFVLGSIAYSLGKKADDNKSHEWTARARRQPGGGPVALHPKGHLPPAPDAAAAVAHDRDRAVRGDRAGMGRVRD